MTLPTPQLRDLWLLVPFVLLNVWVGGCFLISCMGWLWFGRKYPAGDWPTGKVHRVPSVKFEFFGSYRNMVRVVFAEEGIYFFAPFFLRPFHAPFLLPWESVRRVKKKGGFTPAKRVVVEVEDAEGPIRLWFPSAAEQDLLRYYRAGKQMLPARRAFPGSLREGAGGEDGDVAVPRS
ncbi:MAG: hypothetical protein ACAH88_07930 [Roseimicrobium sp.]